MDGNSIPRIKLKEAYGQILSKYKAPIRFLEIGLDTGLSLNRWQTTFPNSEIYGLDITLKNLQINRFNHFIFELDSTDEPTINKTLKNVTFDVIVDDGGPEVHVETFKIFHRRLNPGGTYLIETFKRTSATDVVDGLRQVPSNCSIECRTSNSAHFIVCTKDT